MSDDTNGPVDWSIHVGWSEFHQEWRAVAFDHELMARSASFNASGPRGGPGSDEWADTINDSLEGIAVTAGGETPGQAVIAACQWYEHEWRARRPPFERGPLVDPTRWRTRPAPRRTSVVDVNYVVRGEA